jgi:hypothetical protein
LQVDQYAWDPDRRAWALQEGWPRVETGPCASFTEDVGIGVAARIEQFLCSETVPPDQELEIYRISAHDSRYGCWKCYDPARTIWQGSLAQEVYCQAPDYSTSNRRIHLDAYQFGAYFMAHAATFACPNIVGLTSSEVAFLCGNPLPKRPTCGR